MSTNNTNVEPTEVDLDAFAADFFGQKSAAPEPASSEADETDDELESDAPEATHTPEGDPLADDEDEEEDGEEEEEEDSKPAPKPKKNRFQERIDELTTARKEAEREAERLRSEFEALKVKLEAKTDKTDKPTSDVVKDNRPNPDAVKEDGSPKYELGEFDPQYQADLVAHLFAEKEKEIEAKLAKKEQEESLKAARTAIETQWNDKLVPAQERYPDFNEKGQQLVDSFEGLDEAYGEYLTSTIMSMDFGPDVLYYLANHPDEAKAIVNSGPTKATLALGRLETKFADAELEKQKARPKVSKAPTPPAHRNKGSAAAVAEIPDDTDDLDLFSQKLFAKK